MNDKLMHYGVLGMKWGVRRSSPTNGQRRKDSLNKGTAGKLFTPSLKNGKDKPNISPAEKMVKETKASLDEASSVARSVSQIKRSKAKNNNARQISKMTDQELKDAVNRLNLERSYKSLTESEINSGMSYVSDILGVVGGVVGIAGSTLAIVSAVKNLK